MMELRIEAKTENLDKVIQFVEEQLEKHECSMKVVTQIDIAVEEIFVNIAHYAYNPEIGSATVCIDIRENPLEVVITFLDQGMPYDPLAKADPDVTLSLEERQIGGLGIFMVKKSMDSIDYRYENGQNILTITKQM